jgi:hypothetical protein
VYSVAGVDTQRNLVGYSTHGPGALDPQKPDIAAYTHWLGFEGFGKGRPDSGDVYGLPGHGRRRRRLATEIPYEIGNELLRLPAATKPGGRSGARAPGGCR